MSYDRAGYMNNYGGYGGSNCYNQGAARERINNSQMVKRVMHYEETYVNNQNECRDAYNSCGACNNYGCNGCNGGFYNGGCGPAPCAPPCGPPCGPPPCAPPCGPPPCGPPCGPPPCGPPCGGFCGEPEKKCKKKKCDPCPKPIRHNINDSPCECKACRRMYEMLYN